MLARGAPARHSRAPERTLAATTADLVVGGVAARLESLSGTSATVAGNGFVRRFSLPNPRDQGAVGGAANTLTCAAEEAQRRRSPQEQDYNRLGRGLRQPIES